MNKKKNVKKNNDRDKLVQDISKGAISYGVGALGIKGITKVRDRAAMALIGAAPKDSYDANALHKAIRGEDINDKLKIFHIGSPFGSHFASEAVSQSGKAPLSVLAKGRPYVAIPRDSVAVAAHELVHSNDLTGRPVNGYAYGASMLATPWAIRYGILKGASGKDLSTADDIGIGATVAPFLAEETRANIGAFNAIRKMKLQHGLLRTALPLIGSELSYATLAASPFIGHYTAKKFRDFEDSLSYKKKKKNVKAK